VFPSLYAVQYQYESQEILLEDQVSQEVHLVEFARFKSMAVTFFGPIRADRLISEVTSGRHMYLSFVEGKMGYKTSSTDFQTAFYQRALSADNIAVEQNIEADPLLDLEEHHKSIMGTA